MIEIPDCFLGELSARFSAADWNTDWISRFDALPQPPPSTRIEIPSPATTRACGEFAQANRCAPSSHAQTGTSMAAIAKRRILGKISGGKQQQMTWIVAFSSAELSSAGDRFLLQLVYRFLPGNRARYVCRSHGACRCQSGKLSGAGSG